MNLKEITNELVKKHVQVIDSGITQYIKSAVHLLESQGEDITKYSLVEVDTPMEISANKIKLSKYWRIIKTSELNNLPIYKD